MNANITYLGEVSTGSAACEPAARVSFVLDRFDQWNNPADSVVYATFTTCRGDAIDAAT